MNGSVQRLICSFCLTLWRNLSVLLHGGLVDSPPVTKTITIPKSQTRVSQVESVNQ